MKLDVTLYKRLDNFALDVAFHTSAPILALFGRSGSGKTSLINCLSGISAPERGRIAIDGTVLFDSTLDINLPPEKRGIGYVFQDALLFPHLSVEKNLYYGARFNKSGGNRINDKHVIGLLGLEKLLNRRPNTLSGGEKQRVAIGRALLANPRMLLMDEPLASLDGARRHEILTYIETLRDQLHIPLVFVSHSLSEVTRLADDLLVLAEGRILACGAVHEIMGRVDLYPHTGRHEAGAVIESKVLDHDEHYDLTHLVFDAGKITMPRIDARPGDPIRVRIRARDVALSTTRPSNISMVNIFEGTLSELSNEPGPIIEARIKIGTTHLIARITRRSADTLGLAIGLPVFALVKAVSIDRRSIGQSS